MKEKVFIATASLVIGAVTGFIVCQNIIGKEYSNLFNAYDYYNKSTEELLDTLENNYGWVDAIDSYEYYDSRAKLDSLLWK